MSMIVPSSILAQSHCHRAALSNCSSSGSKIHTPTRRLLILGSFEQYHLAHARFIQAIESIPQLFATRPLLFWTIVLVASENHPLYHVLYARLIKPHQDLLAPISSTALQTVEDIHALLLLCLWPVMTERPHDDPSWSYVSIVTNYCVRLSLFKPAINRGHPANALTGSIMTSESRYMTLLACFNAGTQ